MKTIVSNAHDLTEKAAREVIAYVRNKPDSVILTGWDECLDRLFSRISEVCVSENDEMLFSRTRIIQAFEFDGSDTIILNRMREKLIEPLGIRMENVMPMDREDPKRVEDVLCTVGGADICIISLGIKGQVCFNETGAAYSSIARKQKLTESTKNLFAPVFEKTGNCVPEYGFTAGMRTVVSAKNIFVLCVGEKFADAVFSMLYARDDGIVPAAFLQLPVNVKIFADEGAAAKL